LRRNKIISSGAKKSTPPEGGAQPVECAGGVVDGELDRVSDLCPICHLLHHVFLCESIHDLAGKPGSRAGRMPRRLGWGPWPTGL
jgi:hypothetical protein